MTTSMVQSWISSRVKVENALINIRILSDRFHISYGDAERHLECFLQNGGNSDISTIYYVSGYQLNGPTKVLKIQLVPDTELERVKTSLDDVIGVHVYGLKHGIAKNVSDIYCFGSHGMQKMEFPPIKFEPKVRNPMQQAQKSAEKPSHSPDKKKSKQLKTDLNQPLDDFKSNNAKPVDAVSTSESVQKKPTIFTAMAACCRRQKASASSNAIDDMAKMNHHQNLKTAEEKPTRSPSNVLSSYDDIFAAESSPENSPAKGSYDCAAAGSPKKSEQNLSQKSAETSQKSARQDAETCKKPVKRKLGVDKKAEKVSTRTKLRNKEETRAESDSEGEGMTSRHKTDEMSDVIPPTPVPAASGVIKKQKMVHKTYLDDEGYLVTVKESETELINLNSGEKMKKADSANLTSLKNGKVENAVTKTNPQNEPPCATKLKAKESNGKKQASLTSFFRK